MKLLFWNELFLPDIGGAEINTAHLIRHFRSAGHACSVIAAHGRTPRADHLTHEGEVDVHRFWFHRALLKRDLAGIREIVRGVDAVVSECAPDLIHLGTSQPSLFFFLRSKAAREIPTVATIYEPPTDSLTPGSLLGQVLLTRTRRIAPCSQAVRAAMLHRLPQLADRTKVIHLGLPPPNAEPLPFPAGAPTLLCGGRLTREKGIDLALEATARLKEEFADLHLTVFGDGPERGALIDLATRLGLGDRVRFPGWIAPDVVPALMAQHHGILVPSRWNEPFGLIALEAAQMARPVVAAADGGLAEIVVDGQTGFLVPPEDVSALAESTAKLLRDPALAARLGRAGRKHAATHFGLDRQAEAIVKLYQDALAQSERI